MTLIPGPAAGSDSAVTHALIVGVSDYPYLDGPLASDFGMQFQMRRLSSAARSASEVAAWLLTEFRKPEAPLASVRILLSPAPGESIQPTVATAVRKPTPATRADVEAALNAFKEDCKAHPDNFAFVYIAGHGVQLTTSASVVLLQDFADPAHGEELTGAIDVAACHRGLSGGGYPEHQIWFADACRQAPQVARRFDVLEGALRASKPTGDVEASSLILAAGPRESAFAETNGTSLFSQVLLAALRGRSADPSPPPDTGWAVRAGHLAADLQDHLDELTAGRPVRQLVDPIGRSARVVVQRFVDPPQCDLVVTLKPPDALPLPRAQVLYAGSQAVPVVAGWPLHARVPMGVVSVQVDVDPPLTRGWRHAFSMTYPSTVVEAEVG